MHSFIHDNFQDENARETLITVQEEGDQGNQQDKI